MPKEIERKYLIDVEELPSDQLFVSIKQGYLSHDKEKVVRVRVYGELGFLTIKSTTKGIERQEYEYEIPLSHANELLLLCGKSVIEKQRARVQVGGKTWEVDQFFGDNAGLWLAEIELSSSDEMFEKPYWVLDEVSQDVRYYNSYLSENPFKDW